MRTGYKSVSDIVRVLPVLALQGLPSPALQPDTDSHESSKAQVVPAPFKITHLLYVACFVFVHLHV